MLWSKPINFPKLEIDQAHIWYASLVSDKTTLNYFFELLSPKEQAQAQRLRFEEHKNRFITAHGILRILLQQYLTLEPAQILFSYNSHGKPFLTHYPELEFNISHSENSALFAFVKNQPVGVDIENRKKMRDLDGIATRYFSSNESQQLKKLKALEKNTAFYNAWTRKEAFLKALGEGLSYPLRQVEVAILPNQKPAILALYDDNLNLSDWSLYDLQPPIRNFAAALVIKGYVKEIKTFLWEDFT